MEKTSEVRENELTTYLHSSNSTTVSCNGRKFTTARDSILPPHLTPTSEKSDPLLIGLELPAFYEKIQNFLQKKIGKSTQELPNLKEIEMIENQHIQLGTYISIEEAKKWIDENNHDFDLDEIALLERTDKEGYQFVRVKFFMAEDCLIFSDGTPELPYKSKNYFHKLKRQPTIKVD